MATVKAGDVAMARRIGLANTAATLCLAVFLLLQLACMVTLPHTDAHNYLWGRIDIPLEVQPIWPTAAQGIGFHAHGIAALAPNWTPCWGFLGFTMWAAALAVYGAVRRNWVLFFAMQVLLVMPGEWFGTNDHEVGPAGVVVSAAIVTIYGLIKRRFRLAIAAVVVAIATLVVHGLVDGHVGQVERANQVFDDSGNGWATDTDAVDRISAAMATATPAQRPAADYVRAQMAYLRQDWPTVKALAPGLRPDRFSHGPYTGKRIFVLQAFAAGRTQLAPMWVFEVVDFALFAAFVLTLACAVTGWRLRLRARRIDTLHQKLETLRPARKAAA